MPAGPFLIHVITLGGPEEAYEVDETWTFGDFFNTFSMVLCWADLTMPESVSISWFLSVKNVENCFEGYVCDMYPIQDDRTRVVQGKLMRYLPADSTFCVFFDGTGFLRSDEHSVNTSLVSKQPWNPVARFRERLFSASKFNLTDVWYLLLKNRDRNVSLNRAINGKQLLHLQPALCRMPDVHRIDLTRCQLNDACASLLARMITNSPHLETVDLEDNLLGDKAAEILAGAIEQNPALRWISLKCNNLRDHGATALFQSVSRNTTLEKLELAGNHVSLVAVHDVLLPLLQEGNTALGHISLGHHELAEHFQNPNLEHVTRKQNFAKYLAKRLQETGLESLEQWKHASVVTFMT